MHARKYRSRLQIVADILHVVSNNARANGARKTRIMYLANLSWELLNRYLNDLMEAGLVSSGSSDRYVLTPKGQSFLDRLSEYFRRREKVEEHLNDLENDRRILENECFNTKEVDEK